MSPSEVIQQRFDRNTCPSKDWGPSQDVWIAVHDDALIFHTVSFFVQCNTEIHARLTARLSASGHTQPFGFIPSRHRAALQCH